MEENRGIPLCHLVVDVGELKREQAEFKGKLFLSQNGGFPFDVKYRSFVADPFVKYLPFCDDFGPINVLSVIRFIEGLQKAVDSDQECSIVYSVKDGRRAFTNGAFLLGTYMILKLEMDASDVLACFDGLESFLEPYRDATFSPADFPLSLIDCWNGLKRSVERGWFTMPANNCPGWDRWGRIYRDEYAHFDNPSNGELHEVIPGKLIAFKGPKDLGGPKFALNKSTGLRDFSAEYYVDIFRVLGVAVVVRLNEAQYSASSFVDGGIHHHDLSFPDNAPPPSTVIVEFFKIVDEADGLVAVHCGAGLGRTGTLIALYMMRSYGFSAREAIGWLRIMRPGSVIGDQQHFLCTVEEAVRGLLPGSAASTQEAGGGAASGGGQVKAIRSCLRKGRKGSMESCDAVDGAVRPHARASIQLGGGSSVRLEQASDSSSDDGGDSQVLPQGRGGGTAAAVAVSASAQVLSTGRTGKGSGSVSTAPSAPRPTGSSRIGGGKTVGGGFIKLRNGSSALF